MPNFNFVLLYVDDPAKSAAFYSDLLGKKPMPNCPPTFAMLPLNEQVMLGLWARHDVKPAATGAAGTTEVAFGVADADAVRQTHADWSKRGVRIAQPPIDMGFGCTFTAVDPDGHRLRVTALPPQ